MFAGDTCIPRNAATIFCLLACVWLYLWQKFCHNLQTVRDRDFTTLCIPFYWYPFKWHQGRWPLTLTFFSKHCLFRTLLQLGASVFALDNLYTMYIYLTETRVVRKVQNTRYFNWKIITIADSIDMKRTIWLNGCGVIVPMVTHSKKNEHLL